MQNDLVHLHQLQPQKQERWNLRGSEESHSVNMKTSKSKLCQGTTQAGADAARHALANVGQDDIQHIDADIPMSVVELVSAVPGDAADDMEQETAIRRFRTHNIVRERVT